MEQQDFFSKPENRKTLTRAISKLTELEGDIETLLGNQEGDSNYNLQDLITFTKARNEGLKKILQAMLQEAIKWNQSCQININRIGSQLFEKLAKISPETTKTEFDLIFALCYRFLLEHYLSIAGDFNIEYEQLRIFGLDNMEKFEIDAQEQLRFAAYFMPLAMFKTAFNDTNVVNVKNLNQLHETSEKMLNDWKEEIRQSEERANQLKEVLEKHKTAFNFVGLYDGFKNLSEVKERERQNLVKWVRIAGLAILFPIALDFFLVFYNVNNLEDLQRVALISFIPMASIIAIFIYYFRVLLHNLNEVKAQLLQIELRKTLCQFIQSYVDYSNGMKQKGSESLSKFENIIFSGLVSSNERLPSTFDGLEQLTSIIQSIRKS